MLRVVLILTCFVFAFCKAATELSPGAKQCFFGVKSDGKKRMEGKIRRVKLAFCDSSERIKKESGFAFDDLRIRVGNVLFNKDKAVERTILMKNTQVQICMHGKLDTNRLRGTSTKLQISAHGNPTLFPNSAIGEALPDLGIDVPFCDLDPNGCHTTEPGCDEVIPGSGVQEFCTCSTLEVPDYAPAGTIVEVTWKLLQTPSSTNVDVCEQKFDIEKLWKEERKETLACLKIPAAVKNCEDLCSPKEIRPDGSCPIRDSIIGCKPN